MIAKGLLLFFVVAQLTVSILAYKDGKDIYSFETSIMFTMALCTLAICHSIDNKK